jgi:para-aminobenzoate synthetase/4-amino-4-deoxychorismate lyase
MNRWYPLPAGLYALVERSSATVLLESAKPGTGPPVQSPNPNWSRLFTAPLRVLEAHRPAQVSQIFAEIEEAVAAGCFAAGYFSYEFGHWLEPTTGQRVGVKDKPLAWFGIYDRCYRFDHITGRFLDGDPPGLAEYSLSGLGESDEMGLECRFDLSAVDYGEAIATIHAWIRAGDVYQLNFTAPVRVRTSDRPALLYKRLRQRQPVAYGAFLHTEQDRRILSFSPELFFRLDASGKSRRIFTRPMKGTAPRGRTTAEDRALAEWLRKDPKNRAENVMIVDLLRNDIGRLCAYGSVQVEDLFAVERYPTLWQMTSTVSGQVRPEVGFEQIFRALFPCGSITGAPKVRAMQLLAQLEDEPRGVYTGAIGFFSREQTIFNVAIRTLELDGRSGEQIGKMGVGSGIVIDSVAAEEFRECVLKTAFLTGSAACLPDGFSLVETLLWKDGYPLLELHLDRLQDSASYFDFACNREETRSALLAHAVAFTEPRKVRLLLDREGILHIASEMLQESGSAGPIRVRIAAQCTDSSDRMLFHKTTHRPLYAQAWKAAIQDGFDDVLFLNQRGEVTESAIGNLFLEKDSKWFTPPVECGLLAGVQRRLLLDTRSEIEQRVLLLEDLRQADAVYLSNAVRGLRRVTIDWDDYALRL